MWKLIGQMFINIAFVTVLYLVSYTNRDPNAILQVQHLQRFFCNTRNSTYNFTGIISIDGYWRWLQTSFVSNIRVERWYNGDPVKNVTDFLDDKSSRIIGSAIMRQLRLRLNAICKIPVIIQPLISSCKGSYSILSDERGSYAPGWVSSTNVSYSTTITNSFIYRSSAELDSYIYIGSHGTYGSGGYVYEFRGDIQELQENLTLLRRLSWLDEQSRAVMIQLNLYNPNVNFFTSVTLLVEISNTGQVFPSARIEPMQMYTKFNDFSSIFYLIIAFVYIQFIIYFTIIEVRSIIKRRKKYFRQIRSYVEWGIIICSWTGVGVYIWRYHEAHRIGDYFRYTNGFQYINLQFATYVNDILTFLLGFCCFFATIRLLRLFDIYPRIYVFTKTLHRAFKDIVAFTFMYFFLFSGFVILFYLLFVSKMGSCSSILQTSGMLFEMLLLKFDTVDLENADAFLGPFVFALFIYYCVFVGFTMFVVIVREHFRHARREMHEQKQRRTGILRFIIKKIIKRTGIKISPAKQRPAQKPVIIPPKPITPTEQLLDKVSALLIVVERMYTTSFESESMTLSEHNELASTSAYHLQGKRRRGKHVIYSE